LAELVATKQFLDGVSWLIVDFTCGRIDKIFRLPKSFAMFLIPWFICYFFFLQGVILLLSLPAGEVSAPKA